MPKYVLCQIGWNCQVVLTKKILKWRQCIFGISLSSLLGNLTLSESLSIGHGLYDISKRIPVNLKESFQRPFLYIISWGYGLNNLSSTIWSFLKLLVFLVFLGKKILKIKHYKYSKYWSAFFWNVSREEDFLTQTQPVPLSKAKFSIWVIFNFSFRKMPMFGSLRK